jgi:hypothetical protein
MYEAKLLHQVLGNWKAKDRMAHLQFDQASAEKCAESLAGRRILPGVPESSTVVHLSSPSPSRSMPPTPCLPVRTAAHADSTDDGLPAAGDHHRHCAARPVGATHPRRRHRQRRC